jgi:long-chain acyl-CoA synthetase
VLLHKELDPDDEEITRTRKLRRGVITRKYGAIIEALYEEVPLVAVTAEVTYQDGRKALTETKLAIRSVGPGLSSTSQRPPSGPAAR